MDETKDSTERRVVLIKPGDVLLIGNVGRRIPEDLDRVVDSLRKVLHIPTAVFADDIDIDVLDAESLARLSGGES